jgi:DNA polymerase-3 subunit delta'
MSWRDIVGHDAIRDQLRSAYRRGRFAHAYLFIGPSGVGKKRFARELAKALLCETPPDVLAACDRCPACVQVTAGTHPDCTRVRKPEDKHELPIDTIRELGATLGLKPTRGSRKVAIIEEADDFNPESANAFLKCLEEPPPGTTLILLASSAETQLATIRSRCQVVVFPPLTDDSLVKILAANGVTDAIHVKRLIRLAGGSAERALALNDPAVWELRSSILDVLGSARPATGPLVERWSKFIEDAGKDSAAQRLRESVAIGLTVDLIATALRHAVGCSTESDTAEADRLGRFAQRAGVEGLIDIAEKCVEADYFVDRRVQLALITDLVIEKLSRAAA